MTAPLFNRTCALGITGASLPSPFKLMYFISSILGYGFTLAGGRAGCIY